MDQISLTEGVDRGGLMRDVQAFTRHQKLSGSPEELESFHYLEGRMSELGYSTALLSHDAYISLPGKARVEIDNQELTAITHSFSRPSPKHGLTADVVDVGEGSEADFAGKDLRGCIVLAEGIASPAVAVRAAHAGAVGQLHMSPHEHLHEMCISPVWGSPSASTVERAADNGRLYDFAGGRCGAARAARARRDAACRAARRGGYRLAQDADCSLRK